MTPLLGFLGFFGPANGSDMWYLTRAFGAVSLVLLTASVILGVLTTYEAAPFGTPRFVIPEVHRNVSLAVLVFIVLHVATTVLDGYVDIVWIDAVIPFRSPYHTAFLALGTLSFDLLLVVAVTSMLRRNINRRVWRGIHLLSYVTWPLAIVHGWFVGSDSGQGWLRLVDLVCLAALALAVAPRLVAPPRGGAKPGASPIGAEAVVTRSAQPRHQATQQVPQVPQMKPTQPIQPSQPSRTYREGPRS